MIGGLEGVTTRSEQEQRRDTWKQFGLFPTLLVFVDKWGVISPWRTKARKGELSPVQGCACGLYREMAGV